MAGALCLAILASSLKTTRALPRATPATGVNAALPSQASLNRAILGALPQASQTNAQTAVSFREAPLPFYATGKDPAPLSPGLYKTEPYFMLVRVPEPLDEGMLIKAPSAAQFAMRTLEPRLRFQQLK